MAIKNFIGQSVCSIGGQNKTAHSKTVSCSCSSSQRNLPFSYLAPTITYYIVRVNKNSRAIYISRYYHSYMKTYLFAWNSKLWKWHDISKISADVRNGKEVLDRWGTGTSRKIRNNDRFFIIRLGEEPRGIFASGQVVSDVYEDIHWREEKSSLGKTAKYVKIKYDVLLNPENDVILPRQILRQPPFSKMNWDIRMSGIEIPTTIVNELEDIWKNAIKNKK